MDLTSALTPLSPLIAVVYLALVGAALMLIVVGVEQQWRGRGVPGWLVMLAAALLLLGACTWWTVSARLAIVSAIYSSIDGQPSAPVPSALVDSWPLVVTSSSAMMVVGALALVAVLGTALLRLRRDAASTR